MIPYRWATRRLRGAATVGWMRLLALASLLLLTVGVGAAAAQPVPVPVEQQIAKRAGLESYTPARMMTGWHYARWQYVPGELRIWFYNRSHWEVEFVVTPRLTADCAAGKQKTFQLGGNKVYWSADDRPVGRPLPAAGLAVRQEPLRPLDAPRRAEPAAADEARRRRPRHGRRFRAPDPQVRRATRLRSGLRAHSLGYPLSPPAAACAAASAWLRRITDSQPCSVTGSCSTT